MQFQASAIDQTLEQADAQTHQGDDNEHQQQGSAHDGRTNGSSPGHGGGKNIADIANQSGNSNALSRSECLLSVNNYLDCFANEAEANKTEQVENRGSSQEISDGG